MRQILHTVQCDAHTEQKLRFSPRTYISHESFSSCPPLSRIEIFFSHLLIPNLTISRDNFIVKIPERQIERRVISHRKHSLKHCEMERWNGRVALVTGASVGIGAAVCRALVRHGMVVVGCARSVDRIKAIAEEEGVKSSPGRLVAYKCDLTQEAEILTLFEEIRQTYGRLDVCINNAGLSHNAPLLSGTTAEFRNMLDVNVMALCICTQQAVKLMRDKGIDDGQIIQISSMGGHRLPTNMPAANFYCGTKFMVRALTEGLRREIKALNSHIRIASISPGMVETEFFDRFMQNDPTFNASDIFAAMKALQPDDIAESLLYILRAPPHVEVHDILMRPYDQPV